MLTVVFSPDACTYGFYDCHPNATCVPETNGLYRCHCKPGFEGDGRQCTGKFHNFFVECHFLATVYMHPSCPDNSLSSPDSCDPSLHPCGPNSTCVHRSNGDTECPCDPGFIGNGEDGCIGKFQELSHFLCLVLFCCGFVSRAGLTQAKIEGCGELCIQAVSHNIL